MVSFDDDPDEPEREKIPYWVDAIGHFLIAVVGTMVVLMVIAQVYMALSR